VKTPTRRITTIAFIKSSHTLTEIAATKVTTAYGEVERRKMSDPVKRAREYRRSVYAWDYKQLRAETNELIDSLCDEAERLRGEIRHLELTTVPRSRWEQTNADWLEAREQYQDLAKRATQEIERLTPKG
jgi:hypothetical protein